jgi:signal transduction histidine kinase
MEPVLKIVNLSKSFGTLHVLSHVDLEAYPGKILGIAGRNGAGKTTLVSLLAGLIIPNEGRMVLNGERITWPFKARKLGIEVLHQNPELVSSMDIAENIFLGNEVGWPSLENGQLIGPKKRMELVARRILDELGISFPSLHEKVANLNGEQKQMISIARAMVRSAKVMVVDDVTTLLTFPNQKKVLALLQTWQEQGRAVLFFSDNLDHLFVVSDEILVLCDNNQVARFKTDETSREEVVSALVGTTDQQQITPFIWALDNYYRAREKAEELRHRQTLLERDLAAQDTLNKQLINQLNNQVTALDEANRALQDAHRRLLNRRELEQKSLARELHDEIIQNLLSINYELEAIEEDEDVSIELSEKLQMIRSSIRNLIEDLRDTCRNLRPPTLDSLGLGAAITSCVNEWTAKRNVQVQLEIDSNLIRLPETTELAIYRMVQEVLRNIDRHSKASAVEVCLKHTSSRSVLLLVKDNGVGLPKGFDLSTMAKQGHFGLLGISENVALLGGNLSIQNLPDHGTILQVELPHPRAKKAAREDDQVLSA